MSVEVKFGDLHREIQAEINRAKKSLNIAVAWISFDLYEHILKQLKQKGVSINIFCSDSHSNRRQMQKIQALKAFGINITLFKMPNSSNYMHHKFAVVDERVILTGSFNWSRNAVKSFENLIIIKDNLSVVREFMAEFDKIRALDNSAIKSLQSLTKCPMTACNGKIINILVFDDQPLEMTYEMLGDVIQLCSLCGEDNFKTIHNAVQDPLLHSWLGEYKCYDQDDEGVQTYIFDRGLDQHLTGYTVNGSIIHAIGVVAEEIFSQDGDVRRYTKILWKNKFVEEYVLDEYETTFDVYYK